MRNLCFAPIVIIPDTKRSAKNRICAHTISIFKFKYDNFSICLQFIVVMNVLLAKSDANSMNSQEGLSPRFVLIW